MSKMPVLFVGHGSPMNVIEDNIFTRKWEELGKSIPKPEVILSVSAHWYTNGLKISNQPEPKTIYDFYGFPRELYEVSYNVKGSPDTAQTVISLLNGAAEPDSSWGIDHGTWSVLSKMYPNAEIPVLQLSVDRLAPPEKQFEVGTLLKPLREKGVLIFGSGNVVHNLGRIGWNMAGGFPWAEEFDNFIKGSIVNRRFDDVLSYQNSHHARDAVPTPDHFYPLLPILGAADETDKITVFNEECIMGSLSMTGYLLG